MAQTSNIAELEQKLKKAVTDTSRITAMRKLSIAYSSVDPEKKLYYAKGYRVLAEKLKIDSLVADGYIDMGMYYAIVSKMDSAIYYFSIGLDKAKAANYQKGMGRSLVNMGFAYDRLDNKQSAIKSYMQALKIFKKIKLARGINQCYINIGSIYYDLEQYLQSKYYFDEALKSFTKEKDEPGIAKALFSLASVYKFLGQYDKAREAFEKSLEMRTKNGDFNGIALGRMGLASLDTEQKRYNDALKNLDIALEYNNKIKDPYQESSIYLEMAKAHLGNKNYKQAELYGKKLLVGSENMQSKLPKSRAYKTLAEIYEAKKEINKAYHYQNLYILNQDSIAAEKTAKDVTMIEFGRITSENTGLVNDNKTINKKNTDYLKTILATSVLLFLVVILVVLLFKRNRDKHTVNQLLQKRKDEIADINVELELLNDEINSQMVLTAEQNVELEKLNTLKNKFFSIVSHDLRGPLANLQMLFRFYREGELSDIELRALLAKLEETIYTTSAFLDNLLEWSKSQLEGITVNPSFFNLSNLVTDNIKLLETQIRLKQLDVLHDYQDLSVYADSNMINVVVRNLLSNSVKFCHTGCKIVIDIKHIDDTVVFSISDSGPGIAPADQAKLFQLEHTISKGTYGEKGNHLGLILCKDMVEQNNGSIAVQSELGKGTVFTVTLRATSL